MNLFIIWFLTGMAICMTVHGMWKGRGKSHHGKGGHKHGSFLSVDYFAYASEMRKWNASFKMIFAMVCLLLCILLNNIYVSIAVILMMGYLTVVIGGLSFSHYLSMLTVPVVFLIFGTVAIALGFSLDPVGQYRLHVLNLFYIYCSDASLLKAGQLVFKAFGAVSALYMMTLTTPLSELIVVLRKAHIPKVLIELMNMIYRYLFIMMDTHSRMKHSAEARLGYVDFKTSCYSFGQVAGNLLIVSLKRGTDYYNALEARCYDGDLRFLEEKKPLKRSQIVMAAVFVVLLLAIWKITTTS
ncbi:MAG: cobalt ECF transporter T component CbiQ [Eubacteriales bacterium]|nr:cobalt ECF transporter T component CbiQ [Eubacteriales bacterium]